MQPSIGVSDGFCYTLTQGDDTTVVNLFGELDMASAPALATGLQRLAGAEIPVVVIDLSELVFCDSSGLGVLLKFHEDAKEAGIRVIARSPSPNVRRIFELTNATKLLEIDSE